MTSGTFCVFFQMTPVIKAQSHWDGDHLWPQWLSLQIFKKPTIWSDGLSIKCTNSLSSHTIPLVGNESLRKYENVLWVTKIKDQWWHHSGGAICGDQLCNVWKQWYHWWYHYRRLLPIGLKFMASSCELRYHCVPLKMIIGNYKQSVKSFHHQWRPLEPLVPYVVWVLKTYWWLMTNKDDFPLKYSGSQLNRIKTTHQIIPKYPLHPFTHHPPSENEYPNHNTPL